MAGTETERTTETTGPCYYTAPRVAYWLDHWRELQALAIPTAAGVRYDKIGTIPDGMRLSDPMRYSDIVTDIERATLIFRRWSLHYLVVEATMRGDSLVDIADGLRVSIGVADRAFRDASEAIAWRLGWEG